MDFKAFKTAVATKFSTMSQYRLFRSSVDKDTMWETYLKSFPEGSNPMFRERTEHDCNYCKQFVRAAGGILAIDQNGQLISPWDINLGDSPYQQVANALSALVKSNPIQNVFLHDMVSVGRDKSFEELVNQDSKTWEHLFFNLPASVVVKDGSIDTKLGKTKSTHDVMWRGLTELTDHSLDMVLDLISQNSLYRGEEFKFMVEEFQKVKKDFDKRLTKAERETFVWSRMLDLPESVSCIRNTLIGTLLVDLSEGLVDLDSAVGKYESKAAPENYKRTSAVVTKGMLDQAKAKISELGLLSALDRRFATLSDLPVNSLLFTDQTSKMVLTGNIFDELAAGLPQKAKSLDKIEEVSVEKFISDILPRAQSLEVLVENIHVPNLVSLIGPSDPTAGQLFKWANNFSWDYNNGAADAIKEKVKKAGGSVAGDLCCRLAWYNYDDLDLHMVEPGGYEIQYTNKGKLSPSGGKLDVDMNAGVGQTREAVENIFYTDRKKMREGTYQLIVHNFARRETKDVGFDVEIDFLGVVHKFAYDKMVKNNERIVVAEFKYSHANGIEFTSNSLTSSQTSKKVWGVQTQAFHKVQAVTLSPNHWAEPGIGNKHYMFWIDGCINENDARGFYNEHLRSDLDPHRKAFDMVGATMRAQKTNNQLSGLGFSSTVRHSVVARVKGATHRTVKIIF